MPVFDEGFAADMQERREESRLDAVYRELLCRCLHVGLVRALLECEKGTAAVVDTYDESTTAIRVSSWAFREGDPSAGLYTWKRIGG